VDLKIRGGKGKGKNKNPSSRKEEYKIYKGYRQEG
jgi:hypothetical protein